MRTVKKQLTVDDKEERYEIKDGEKRKKEKGKQDIEIERTDEKGTINIYRTSK